MNSGLRTFVLVLAACILAVLPARVRAESSASPNTEPCGVGTTGNVDAIGIVDLSDLSSLVSYLTGLGFVPPCLDEANINATGIVDLADLSMLIAYLTQGGVTLPPCPNAVPLMSASVRSAALADAKQQIVSLIGLPVDQFLQQMYQFFQGRPEYEASGIDTAFGNVWARFTDGVPYVVTRGLEFSPDTLAGDSLPFPVGFDPFGDDVSSDASHLSIPAIRRDPNTSTGTNDDLPKSASVRILQSVGNGFPSVGVTTRRLISWLKSANYDITSTSALVTNLKKVGDDGVLYFLGHGAATHLKDGTRDYALSTTSRAVDTDELLAYENEVAVGRLCIMSGVFDYDQFGAEVVDTRYGFTSRFVSYYWKPFAPNALVFINACRSDSSASFKAAVQAKGGPAYCGWTRIVNCADACDVAEFMIDRMLGANKHYRKESPPQRPFDAAAVYGDLVARGLHVRPNSDPFSSYTTVFHYTPGSSNFGLLAPSLAFMSVEEELGEQLYLEGTFGADPQEDGRVMVGGTPLTVTSWTPTEIKCDLPRDGAGSEGPVTVEIRGNLGGLAMLTYHESNVVNLTSWRIPFHYTHQEGGAKVVVDMHLHIRGDIHAHREVIHEPPVNLVGVPFHHDLDSYGTYTASGSGTACADACCWTDTWSGSGQIPVVEFATTTTALIANGGIDPLHHTLTMALGAGVEDGINDHYCSCAPGCYDGQLGWMTDPAICEALIPQPYFTMYLNNNFDVLTGERTPSGIIEPTNYIYLFPTPPVIKLSWPETAASFPPDSSAAR